MGIVIEIKKNFRTAWQLCHRHLAYFNLKYLYTSTFKLDFTYAQDGVFWKSFVGDRLFTVCRTELCPYAAGTWKVRSCFSAATTSTTTTGTARTPTTSCAATASPACCVCQRTSSASSRPCSAAATASCASCRSLLLLSIYNIGQLLHRVHENRDPLD